MVLIQLCRTRLVALVFTLGLCAIAVAGWGGAPVAHAQATSTTLSGFVLNYKGEFVAGATIHLYREPEHTDTGISAITNADGAWSLDTGSNTGTLSVSAEAPGYSKTEQTVYATSYQTGITEILRALATEENQPLVATISGQVTSVDGVPLGGVNIIANDRQDTGVRQVAPPPILSATVTDGDGNYSLQVPAGTIWLTMKTGAAWGYQLVPINITAGEKVSKADFKAAVRVLPRTEFPTETAVPQPTAPPATATEIPAATATAVPAPATATPQSNVNGNIGMPSTGNPDGAGLWLLLIGVGLLLVLGGRTLAIRRHS
ncbi:MAG: carboxypeptidase-like regulatory domain-containing protein [Chloroflexota bacterium]|nr:carboxypeptidase-like regulatory domain-containing protein [Chloroflexota bacterium]